MRKRLGTVVTDFASFAILDIRYSANARADTGGKFQLLAWAFHTAATVINWLVNCTYVFK